MVNAARRGPGRPRNPVSKETLLQAAGMAFAERGYAGASMSDIAGRAGIQKASLFHHFATKEALYMEVLSSSLGGFASLIDDARLADLDDPFLDRLDRLTGVVSDYVGGHPQTARLVLREFIDRGPFARGAGREVLNGVLRATADFIAAGIEEGALPEQDPLEAVMTLSGVHMVYFAAVEASEDIHGGDIFTPERVAQRRAVVIRQVRGLLGAPASS